jgi:hypothetical protein
MKAAYVLVIVLSVICTGLFIAKEELAALLFLTIVVIVGYQIWLDYGRIYLVYNICGVIYCGPDADIPEDATDVMYFDKFTDAEEYCNHLAEGIDYEPVEYDYQ